jgi:predicted 3-demethylubiquinone-9 3-methyltransferase (glyoxalase superfamily)
MQKLVTSLWFDDQAEEAAEFYVSVFPDSKVLSVSRYGVDAPRPEGMALVVDFELSGQTFNALNGGPEFKFTEATSVIVNCKDQEEVDYFWDALTADGGQPSQCGWLKDKFGFSWQIVPTAIATLLSDPDPEKSSRVMRSLLQMSKLDIAELQAAYDGK